MGDLKDTGTPNVGQEPARSRLCLNMIVRDEAPIIRRCLAAAAPWIDSWVICDTGSSDGTPEIIQAFFAQAGIPGELTRIRFDDFSSARNLALDACRASAAAFDYVLLADADMELVVEEPAFRERLGAHAYLVLQRSSISYRNVRLLRRDSGARYVGVTHECLDTGAAALSLDGIWFRDHCNGSSRAVKVERDLRLLTAGLEREPENSRYAFYLAQTLREAGRPAEALEWYRRRMAAGGWAEEVWYARYAAALCLRDLGDEDGFVRDAQAAHEVRPWRAEPLFHLARYLRQKGQNERCFAVCEIGERIPFPNADSLFVEDAVYLSGFREEMAIAGYYCASAERRRRAAEECLRLTVDASASPQARAIARQNSRFYAPLASEAFGRCGIRPLRIPLEPPFVALNPSVWSDGERHLVIVRTVNYALDDFSYVIRDGSGRYRTRNWLLTLDEEFRPSGLAREIRDLAPGPPRYATYWEGIEDCRLFALGGKLMASGTVIDRNPDPRTEIAVVTLDAAGDVVEMRVQHSVRPDINQKNWVPLVRGDELYFVYKTDPTVILRLDPQSGQARVDRTGRPGMALEHLRGGSQAIAVPGGWLFATHEVIHRERPRRTYLHRFVLLDDELRVRAVTDPFTFLKRDVEICLGLARDPSRGRLVASFGAGDEAAYLAFLDECSVLAALRRVPIL